MAKIVSIADRIGKNREQVELEGAKNFFVTQVLPYLTHEEKLEVMNAMQNKDMDAYRAITEPVLMRNIIREYNTN